MTVELVLGPLLTQIFKVLTVMLLMTQVIWNFNGMNCVI